MKVADIMTTPVITVRTDTSVAELLQVFKETGVSGLPVVDDAGRLAGIVSRQDVVLEELRILDAGAGRGVAKELDQILNGGFATVSAQGLKSHTREVREIMTPGGNLVSCKKTTTLAEACEVMARNRVHRLPVLSGKKLVGILSTFDVVRAVAAGQIGEI